LSDLIYLYAAYTIIWASVFAYLVKFAIDQHKLTKDIELLEEVVDAHAKD